MALRIAVVLTVFAMILWVQIRTVHLGTPAERWSDSASGLLDVPLSSVAVADNHDEGDNADNNADDNDGSDNDSGDNDGADNEDNDSGDNDTTSTTSDPNEDIVIENVSPSAAPASADPAPAASPSAPAAPAPASAAASPAPAAPAGQPATEASGTSTGGDLTIALPDNRVAIQVFPSMPAGTTLTIRLIDPVTVPAAPGVRVGDLIWAIEARDSTGAALATLPAEINVTATYADRETGGLDDTNVTLSRLDPATSQWTPAPKIVSAPDANVVTASVMELGTYVVWIP